MHCELITLVPRSGQLHGAMARLEAAVAGPALLGCWHTVLGHAPRIFVLRRAEPQVRLDGMREAVIGNQGVLSLADAMQSISIDTYATFPCLPDVTTGAFGAIYEFRIYQLQPMGALKAALAGWHKVIQTRLDIAPITTVMHSTSGAVPRLVHVYPYRDLAHRLQIRERLLPPACGRPRAGPRATR